MYFERTARAWDAQDAPQEIGRMLLYEEGDERRGDGMVGIVWPAADCADRHCTCRVRGYYPDEVCRVSTLRVILYALLHPWCFVLTLLPPPDLRKPRRDC